MRDTVSQRPWQRVYIFSALLLLFMILSRLTWMQLRHYGQHEALDAMVSRQVSMQWWPTPCSLPAADRLPPHVPPALVSHLAEQSYASLWVSPGLLAQEWLLCKLRPAIKSGLHWQMGLFVVSVTAAVWLARFLTSSWIVALLVGASLLSRGALLSRLGTMASDLPLSFCITLWLAALAHFVRTGAGFSFILANFALSVATLYEPACLLLFLALPCFLVGCYFFCRKHFGVWYHAYEVAQAPLPAISKSRPSTVHRQRLQYMLSKFRNVMEGSSAASRFTPDKNIFARGNLFRTIDVPFIFWIYHNRRWLKLSLANLTLFVIFACNVAILYDSLWQWPMAQGSELFELISSLDLVAFTPLWIHASLDPIDLHYFVCIALVLTCCMNSPVYGLLSLLECLWILFLALLLLAIGTLTKGLLQFTVLRMQFPQGLATDMATLLSANKMFVWLEPVMLTLGIVCLYHLIKVFETRLDVQLPSRHIAGIKKVH